MLNIQFFNNVLPLFVSVYYFKLKLQFIIRFYEITSTLVYKLGRTDIKYTVLFYTPNFDKYKCLCFKNYLTITSLRSSFLED